MATINRSIILLICLAGLLAGQASGPRRGNLFIVGGGKIVPALATKFVELGGGVDGNFVVFPTAEEDKQIDIEKEKKHFSDTFGVKNVTVLHTRDRDVANSEEFTAPLLLATGVWFEGGRQWRLADAYIGTRTVRELRGVLERGGVVGGSSAGATILGSYLVRGAVSGNTIMMSPDHEKGFGLMRNVAIDQHIMTRHREADLDPVIAAHPDLLGIGIDESTAIVVHGHKFEVIGNSKVAIHDNRDHDGKKYYFLSPGDTFDLRKE